MAYVVVDGATGRVACASGGHPSPRLVLPGGETRALEAHGLVLGVDAGQEYAEVQAELPPGGALVLYTDGVVEARRDGELYGDDRLDRLLAEHAGLPARELAAAVASDAREFAGGARFPTISPSSSSGGPDGLTRMTTGYHRGAWSRVAPL